MSHAGRLNCQDMAIWNGDGDVRPVGSSGKVRDVRFACDGRAPGLEYEISWGGGRDEWHSEREVLTVRQAANRGVEPWASALSR